MSEVLGKKRARGRPRFQPTANHRRTVEQMVAVGEPRETIARAIGIGADTLDLYFSDELANGRSRRRKEVLDLLWKSARRGNVSAQKALVGMIDVEPTASTPPKEPRPPKIGKKEEAELEAQTAADGTEWGHLVH